LRQHSGQRPFARDERGSAPVATLVRVEGLTGQLPVPATAQSVGQRVRFVIYGSRARALGVDLEGGGAVAGQRQAAHDGAHGCIGERVQFERAACRLVGAEQIAGREPVLRVTEQRVQRASGPVPALREEPVLERGRVGNGEPFHELALHQGCGVRPVFLLQEVVEAVGIELDGTDPQLELIACGVQIRLAQAAAQDADRLAQRLAGGRLILVGPEETDGMLAGAAPRGCPSEVEQQREVLAPEEIRGCRRAVHHHLDRSECAAEDHVTRSIGSRAGAAGAGRCRRARGRAAHLRPRAAQRPDTHCTGRRDRRRRP